MKLLLLAIMLTAVSCSNNTVKTNKITKSTVVCTENNECEIIQVNGVK